MHMYIKRESSFELYVALLARAAESTLTARARASEGTRGLLPPPVLCRA